MRDLSAIPFVVGPKGTEYTEMITRVLANHHLSSYGIAARISNFEGVKDVVRAGLGIGLLPHFMIREYIRAGALKQLSIAEFNASAGIMCTNDSSISPPTTRGERLSHGGWGLLASCPSFKELTAPTRTAEIDKVIKLGRLDLGPDRWRMVHLAPFHGSGGGLWLYSTICPPARPSAQGLRRRFSKQP
jgi:hypothetical protein